VGERKKRVGSMLGGKNMSAGATPMKCMWARKKIWPLAGKWGHEKKRAQQNRKTWGKFTRTDGKEGGDKATRDTIFKQGGKTNRRIKERKGKYVEPDSKRQTFWDQKKKKEDGGAKKKKKHCRKAGARL